MTKPRKKPRSVEKIEEVESLEKAVLCARVAASHKAEKPLIFHVAEIASFTDYFVICSGRSTRHVQTIAQYIEKAVRERRVKPLGLEGLREGQWVLLDLGEVIVHVFYEPVRAFYDLEGLWAGASKVDFSEKESEK
jgi:ribosome-associated protein